MWKQLAHRVSASAEAQREELTMVLYMAIVILSVLVLDKPAETAGEDIRLIIGSAVGILAAHVLAFRLATQYHEAVHPPESEQSVVDAHVARQGGANPERGSAAATTEADTTKAGLTEAGTAEADTHFYRGVDVSTFAMIRATLVVVVLASAPYLMLPLGAARWVSFLVLTLIIGLAAYVVGMASGRSRTRALIYTGVVIAVAVAVAVLKGVLAH
jgi:hypothetical protein